MRRTPDSKSDRQGPLAALARPIALTRAGMVVERGLRAFWPLASVFALMFTALAFGAPWGLVPGWRVGLGVVVLALLVAALWSARGFRWPSRQAAILRLDASLPGRPLSALTDRMALGGDDPAAGALWRAHLRRKAEVALAARPVRPDPDLARHDPYALRLVALTAVVVAVIFGAPLAMFDGGSRLAAPGAVSAAMGPAWEGWAEPPRYTGKPGLYLNKVEGDQITVPEGTRFALRFYG
ncbi:MAG TPA: DUF4175 family protein, partial [Paenirhodobacter sp.]